MSKRMIAEALCTAARIVIGVGVLLALLPVLAMIPGFAVIVMGAELFKIGQARWNAARGF